ISWSRQGYENASYCISQTGRQPAMQRPIAVPMIPASASGVSKQRSGPKRSRSPAVALKTPPARPTSSPITITDGSRSSSTCRPSLIASTIESSATEDPPQLFQIRSERRRRIDVRVREQQLGIRGWLALGSGDPGAHRVRRLGPNRGRELVVQDAGASEVTLVATDALALLLLLHALRVDVHARVVGRRVRCGAIRHRLDERRAVATTRTRNGVA